MVILDRFRNMKSDRKMTATVTAIGAAGLLLIMLSSLIPEKEEEAVTAADIPVLQEADSYCRDTERRLETFLSGIEGAGQVKVYLAVGSNERYVYASEGKRSETENRVEEEEKYVMTGSGSEKKALVETVKPPQISSAVIAASGCDSPSVRERLYRSAAAALDIPTAKIYVTTLGQGG